MAEADIVFSSWLK